MNLTRTLCLGALVCAVAVAEPAAASIQPAGTGEPAYTNSAQNTQWFEWGAVSGIDDYKARFDYYENNVLKASPAIPATNGATNQWASWSGVANLQHGAQYGICAQGSYSFPNDDMFFADGPNSCSMGTMLGRRAYTTIDRSKPEAAISLASGAAYTTGAAVPLKVDFSDDVAGPFPANFLCFQFGGGPDGVCNTGAGHIYGYSAGCSVPGAPGKSTYFGCTADYSAATDGRVWACVIAADASIPDNPAGPNQMATAERANLSGAKCDDIVLDRKAPRAAFTAPATAPIRTVLTFSSTAADGTSGIKVREWSFGDRWGGKTGTNVTHAFTQLGTFTVTLKVTDKAGNVVSVQKPITITKQGVAGRSAAGTTASAGEPVAHPRDLAPFAHGEAGAAKAGKGPRALPDGRLHGERPARTVAAADRGGRPVP
jgi:PKD domain